MVSLPPVVVGLGTTVWVWKVGVAQFSDEVRLSRYFGEDGVRNFCFDLLELVFSFVGVCSG